MLWHEQHPTFDASIVQIGGGFGTGHVQTVSFAPAVKTSKELPMVQTPLIVLIDPFCTQISHTHKRTLASSMLPLRRLAVEVAELIVHIIEVHRFVVHGGKEYMGYVG